MIAIDGWQVPGFETKVSAGIKLAGDDLSGFGSFALSSDNGVKPAVLSVQTKIPFVDEIELAELITKAKAIDANGARVVYTITNSVATAYKVRKAKFDGEIKATELDELKGWQVSFNLLEVRSVSEREQQQLDATTNSTPQATTAHEQIQQKFAASEGP
ncbi:hypothetical protein [Pseudoalteromonas tunicata]|jgi:hypothetical protein|uniref:Probable phage protein n=1 Tax=Pseudoalteromonas tunicata D2 TaxID=87626 RepID=A4C8V0_9GAMM|nr:hypothetical protein [Pseudoalteromonas tunicata]ATC93518.1 hypothetical protein PTUN_a0787 [Pseudoalteromonas tunicata]AXT29363.1 hypothetical protein D1819_00030 [Pseudoalteromonas tunicata]EAR29015.1 probable phage protein [Pseudoalteromonas tunicata D2]